MDDVFSDPLNLANAAGAVGKVKVVVAVEADQDRPRFAKMRQVQEESAQELVSHFKNCLMDDVIIRTDGLGAHQVTFPDQPRSV